MKPNNRKKRWRGAATVEHIVILCAFTVPTGLWLFRSGDEMLRDYYTLRDQILSPFP
jgi:hypothetical protein